jgi:monoterpene epsilon-lactone hydrolase
MPSLRAKFFNLMIRTFLRKQRWGRDEWELAKRARRSFGGPGFLQKLAILGLDVKAEPGPDLCGEWLIPANAAPGAVILYIHGGGFVSCSSKTHRPITAALARKTGMKVFAIDYRLAPEHRYPAALDDVFEGYKRLRELAGGKIALAGDSAGGGLVLSLLLRIRESGLWPPECAVCFSPWSDLTASGDSAETNKDVDAMFHRENAPDFARAYLGDAPAAEPDASPVFADYHDIPPILFQVGSTEMLLDDSRRIHEKIIAAGGKSELEIFEDVSHCWQMLNWFVPEAGQALDHAAEFIRGHI